MRRHPGAPRHPLTVISSAEEEREPTPLSSLVISSSFPATQPTVPALSEASSRHINVIFPLVFLTAVLNSYETLKAAARWEPLAGLSVRVSGEGFAPAMKKKKNLVFPPSPSIHPPVHPSLPVLAAARLPLLSDACGGLDEPSGLHS